MTRRTLLAIATLGAALAAVPPAAAAVPVDMRGSYFGSFVSDTGEALYSDLNITLQAGKVISGTFNMGGVLRGVLFSGRCRPRGGFFATAVLREGDGKTRIRLEGIAAPAGDGVLTQLSGTYRLSGRRKESGSFNFTGAGGL